jgi:hypothetical protein
MQESFCIVDTIVGFIGIGGYRVREFGIVREATSEESIALIAEDVAYQVEAGYAQIIEWEEL